MDTTSVLSLLLDTLNSFGLSALYILTATIGIGLAYLVFNQGWRFAKASLEGGAFIDSMGTAHKTRRERDEMNETIDRMGW